MSVRDTPWEPGTPSWVDLMSADLPAAADFYSTLFGWDVAEGRPEFGGYRNAFLGDRYVCGLAPLMAEGQPTTWGTYLSTADAESTAQAIQAAGGTIVAPPMDVADLGRMVIAQAPDGGVFGVWQAGTHLGCTVVNEPGALIWTEYLTTSYAAAVTFYRDVFGYGVDEIGGDAVRYSTIAVDGRVVAGIGEVQDGGGPRWRLYFSSVDVDETVRRAVDLGASVATEVHDSPFGRWAALADPQGAQFAVITPPAG